jgi:ketosteroid isomerase-like protein
MIPRPCYRWQMLPLMCVMILVLPAHAQEWSTVQKEVWRTVEIMWELSAKGDVEGHLTYADDEISLWLQNEPLPTGKATFRKWITYDAKSGKTLIQDLRPVTIMVFPDFAFVHYYASGIYQEAPTAKPEYGSLRITDIFRKKGDKWLWVGGHNSNVPEKW